MTTATDSSVSELLTSLGIADDNSGAFCGRWLDTQGKKVESINPTTGEVLATVRSATADDYETVAAATAEAFAEWRTWPAPKRGEVIRQLGDALRQKKDALGRLVTLEMGKILSEGLGEVQEMIDMVDLAVGMSRQLYGLSMHSERDEHRMYEQWHPLGPVGIVTAFNFPVAVWAWNATVAAICGDSMIWKPSSKTPLCGLAISKIAQEVLEANDAPPIFNLVIGDRKEVGQHLVADSRVPLISATGSVSMGRGVGQVVAQRLGRSLLELGGNNGIIVTDDADLDMALRAVLFAAVGTAGQRCTTNRRLFLQKGIATEMKQRLVQAYKSITIGDPMDPATLMGPLVDKKAVDDMVAALETAQQQGRQGPLRRRCSGRTRVLRRADPRRSVGRHADHLRRDLCADPLPLRVRQSGRSHRHPQQRPAGTLIRRLHHQLALGRAVPLAGRQRLRYRQRQHRHLGRGNRWSFRWGEGDRRRTRSRLRFLEGLHATPDLHDQLRSGAPAGSGRGVRRRVGFRQLARTPDNAQGVGPDLDGDPMLVDFQHGFAVAEHIHRPID